MVSDRVLLLVFLMSLKMVLVLLSWRRRLRAFALSALSRATAIPRCRATVLAVMRKRMSFGPSTNSRMAEGAWSSFGDSMRRTRV